MNEMVERVARASFAWWAEHRRNEFVFEDMPEEERDGCLEHARRMIGAMEEPTGAMIESGAQSYGVGNTYIGPGSELLDGQPSRCWRAMIDAALESPQ